MANKKDYYEVLGLQKSATDAEIKKAYRKLAMAHHPDKDNSEGAEKRFREINEAYEVLSDSAKRKKYDQFGFRGMDGSKAGGGQQGGFGGFGGFGGGFGSFEDIFEQFGGGFGGFGQQGGFGGFGQQRGGFARNQKDRPLKGETLLTKVSISFLDSFNGKKENIFDVIMELRIQDADEIYEVVGEIFKEEDFLEKRSS